MVPGREAIAPHASGGAVVARHNGMVESVDAARIAFQKAADAAQAAGESEPRTKGSVAASDAFFPFADGPELALDAGIVAVIQPGGSKRDEEVRDAVQAAGAALILTGRRHFRH